VQVEPILTGRLDLLPLRAEDADEMADVLADPVLYAFTGGEPPTPPSLRARYERQVAGSHDPAERWYNWVIRLRDAGCLCGTVQATVTTGPAAGDAVAEVAWVVGVPWCHGKAAASPPRPPARSSAGSAGGRSAR